MKTLFVAVVLCALYGCAHTEPSYPHHETEQPKENKRSDWTSTAACHASPLGCAHLHTPYGIALIGVEATQEGVQPDRESAVACHTSPQQSAAWNISETVAYAHLLCSSAGCVTPPERREATKHYVRTTLRHCEMTETKDYTCCTRAVLTQTLAQPATKLSR